MFSNVLCAMWLSCKFAQANVNLKYGVNVILLSQFKVITIQHLLKKCLYSLEHVSSKSKMSCSHPVTLGSRHHLTTQVTVATNYKPNM